MLKRCVECENEKPLSEFRKDSSRIGGYRSECKVCSRARIKSVYTQRYSVKYNARTRKKYNERVEFITEYKLLHPCIICGENEVACLDFHHVDPNEKENTVSQMLNGNMEKLMEEINKCVMLCSNCHRKVHAGIITLTT